MSKITAVVAAAVVVVAGVGVFAGVASTLPTPCDKSLQPGKASVLVTPETTSEGAVVASFPTPLKTTGRELSITQVGEGEAASDQGFIDFDVSVFFGADGSYVTGSEYDPANPVRRMVEPGSDDFFSNVLHCALPGSQLVITTTVEDVFGTIDEDEFLQNSSTIVLVVDVLQTYPGKATGSPRLPQSGLPTVVQTDSGVHGISFPNAPVPEDLRISVLKQGDGPAIQEGDFVTAHFTGAVWETRQIFSTSFERGMPLSLIAQDITTSATGAGVIPGVASALIGQAVGSQILVSVPPSLGYPEGGAPPGVADGQTIIYIFDILGTRN
jgi:hypothetical protein